MATIQQILNKIKDMAARTGLFAIGKNEFFDTLTDMTNKMSEINDNVNSVAKSLVWQEPVVDIVDTIPTSGLTIGQRYVLTTDSKIYTATSSTEFDAGTTPEAGWAVKNQNDGYIYSYNGAMWKNTGLTAFPEEVVLSSVQDLTNIQKLQIRKNIDIDLFTQLKVDAVNSGESLTYRHIRGVSENIGNDVYGTFGVACQKIIESDVLFNKISLYGRAIGSSRLVYIRIYTADALSDSDIPNTDWDFVEEVQQSWDTIQRLREVSLNQSYELTSGKILIIAVSTKTSIQVELKRFTTNEFSDREKLLFRITSNYANIFDESWGLASEGYRCASIDLSYVLPYNSEIAGKLSLDGAVSAGYNVYTHPRGSSEYLGDSTYEQNGVGYRMLFAERTIFNQIKFRAKVASGLTETTVKVYKTKFMSSPQKPDTAWTFLEEHKVFLSTTIEEKAIVLNSLQTFDTGDYLVLLFSTKSSNKVTCARWSADTYSDRTGLMYSVSSNLTTIFNEDWYVGAPPYLGVPFKLDIELPSTEDVPEISLPDTICAVVGDKLQLFYRGMIKAVNPYKYDILISCSKGAQYPRYFEYTPVAGDVGTVKFSVILKNNNGDIIASKTCNLVTKAVVQSPVTVRKILCVGDSLTSGGEWPIEASRRLIGVGGTPAGSALSNISFLGRKTGFGIGWEGTGGWNWSNYATSGVAAYRFYVSGVVTPPAIGSVYTNNGGTFTIAEINITSGTGNIRCTSVGIPGASGTLTKSSGTGDNTISFSSSVADSGNPFWYSGALNFTEYVNTYMGGGCDAIYFLLTWNGILPNQTDFSLIITTAKVLIDHIHANLPNCKIKIMGIQVPSINGGIGANYGATGLGYSDGFGLVKTALNMNKAYQDWCNEVAYSSFMEFVNVSSQFDSEYNMQSADVAVNSRSTVTEKRGTNGVHPAAAGYNQIADVVFRNIISNFCQ